MIRLAAAFALLAGPVAAQPACAPYADLAKWLATEHDERRVFEGARNGGGTVEVWSSGHFGTWTLVQRPEGSNLGCVLAGGQAAVVRLPGRSL